MTDQPARILISACLAGAAVRYDGTARTLRHPVLELWQVEGRLVPICPEVTAGLPIPRPPAEIADSRTGVDVLAGRGTVVDRTGADLTTAFAEGAQAALELALRKGCRFALLKEGSPSCGSGFIYDGSFSGQRREGQGVTAALLRDAGIAVYSESQIEALIEAIAA